MTIRLQGILGATLVLVLLAQGCARAPETKVIAVVTKTLDSDFWLALADGARSAGADRPGYQVVVSAPEREVDSAEQARLLNEHIEQRVNALVVAPSGSAQVVEALNRAAENGILVILVDTDAPVAKKSALIGTDNLKGGALAAANLAEAIEGTGEVAVISGVPTSASQNDRVKGFIDEIAKTPGITVVDQQPGNSEREPAKAVMLSFLHAHPGLKGVFATNDEMALGAAEAVDLLNGRGQVAIIGFDGTPDAARAIVEGRMTGSIAQSPVEMGRRGVLSAIALLEGRTVAGVIDSGTDYLDQTNAAAFAK